MERVFSEEAMMIARNILSGANACGTLRKAADRRDAAYFAAAAEVVLKAGREENSHLRAERDAVLKELEAMRFALETVMQNLTPIRSPPGMFLPRNDRIRSLVERILGRSLAWEGM